MSLLPFVTDYNEAGCDEAGRGCLAGPVVAASVILPKDFKNKWLNDSKRRKARFFNFLDNYTEIDLKKLKEFYLTELNS